MASPVALFRSLLHGYQASPVLSVTQDVIKAYERAKLDAMIVPARPTLLEIERRTLRARYRSLPQERRLQVLARVRKELGSIGVRVISGWELGETP